MADEKPKLGEETGGEKSQSEESESTKPTEESIKKDKINAIWEQMNANNFNPKGRATAVPAAGVAPKSSKDPPGWMVYLGLAPKGPLPGTDNSTKKQQSGRTEGMVERQQPVVTDRLTQKQPNVSTIAINVNSEDKESPSSSDLKNKESDKEVARKIASAALASARAAAKVSNEGKIEINEIRDFAGEEVRITKYVDPSSKAAVAARRKAEMQAASSAGLDALLQSIGKKQKLNILDKSRKDWGEFKEEKGIEIELEMHKKSGSTYTEKVSFLQRAEEREFARERDARLALLSRRRNESGSLD